MRIRKKPRHEVVIKKMEVLEQIAIKEPKKAIPKEDSIIEITTGDVQSLQFKHEKELNQLKEQLAKIGKPTKNEEKILNAIKSERLIQKTSSPIIGRNLLMREYKLRPKYLDKSIQSLIQKGLIKRTFIKYSATQNTSKWELLQ